MLDLTSGGSQLLPNQLRKHPGILGISSDQTLWFAAHPMQPFDSCSLHPNGSSSFFASEKVDRSTDAQCDFRLDLVTVLINP
jgi:hypothetical protein